jgi:hypothetical protein
MRCVTVAHAAHPTSRPSAACSGEGGGYQHSLSSAGARRQGAREGGDALECTCAELAHPQGARRPALFRRLSDPAGPPRHLAATCAAAAASKGRRRRRLLVRGHGLPADLCGYDARAAADPPAAVGAVPLPQLRRSLPFPPRYLSVRCCLRSALRPADFFAAGVRGSRPSHGQRRAAEAAAVGTAASVAGWHPWQVGWQLTKQR